MTRIATAFALLLPPVALSAQGVEGTISGTLELEDATWSLAEADDLPASGWEETGNGYSVTIIGYPTPDPASMDGAMTLSFVTDGQISEATIKDAKVTLNRDDPPLMAETRNLDIALNSFEIAGDSLALAGDVVARMVPGGADRLIIDTENAVIFDGDFQATIFRQE